MLNAAARLIFRIPKFDHISPALFHLHWLPVAYRVHFKLLLLVYKTITAHNTLKNICSHTPLLTTTYVPATRTNFKTFGDRAFACSGPFLWNKLPREIRNSQSVVIFKSKLKTYLLKLAYNLL